VIVAPHNDKECLTALSEHVAYLAETEDPALVAIAEAYPTKEALIEWIRSLPQRDDTGDPYDGPKIDACYPIQRFAFPTKRPNCFERSGVYVGARELQEPEREYQLRTIDVEDGKHTLPYEDGEPVILDPKVSRNAVAGAIFRQDCARNAAPVEITPREAIDWIAELADEPAAGFHRGPERARAGHRALRGLLIGRPLCIADLRDAVFVLALGEREARHFGPQGKRIAMTAVHAADMLDQRAARYWLQRAEARNASPAFQIGGYTIRPDMRVLGALARVGGRVGGRVGAVALQAYLTSLGVPPGVYPELERELQKEGLTMGALGKPMPMPGSLGSLKTDALAGRWLASKI
jgi:hypothetical protein